MIPAHSENVVARTIKGFCAAYGVGRTKAYELIAKGKLEVRKVGTRTLITEDSAQRWFSALSHKTSHKRNAERTRTTTESSGNGNVLSRARTRG